LRLLIVDDHAVLREGLRLLLDGENGMQVVAEAADGREALRLAEELRPDIILMDVAMPNVNGLEAARLIKECVPESRIIILSVHDREEYVFEALKAGAAGYLLKECGAADIVAAVKAVAAGNYYLSPRISRTLIEDYLRQETRPPRTEAGLLSGREREVLRLIAEGTSNRQIAGHLCLSPKTVENHRSNIMRKLGVHNRVALVKEALRLGLIELEGAGREASPLAPK
jgi:two-component system response regulator NreC